MTWVRWESSGYWIAFIGTFLAVGVWESARPLRPLRSTAGRRWRNHAALYAISVLCSALVLRVSPVFVAFAVRDSRYGLLNRGFLPKAVTFAVTLAALDLVLYASHRLFHSVHALWRIHEIHHSDQDFDVSTAARFHPLETLISESLYFGAVGLLAPPPAAVFMAQMLIVVENLFVHANKSLPAAVERVLRWIVITPDLHRIHHSQERAEQNLNYGQLFPWWDQIFGTYRSTPACGQANLVTGVAELIGTDTLPVTYMFGRPFQRRHLAPVTTISNSPIPTLPPRSDHS